jgi:hypothetical protein
MRFRIGLPDRDNSSDGEALLLKAKACLSLLPPVNASDGIGMALALQPRTRRDRAFDIAGPAAAVKMFGTRMYLVEFA